MYVDIFSLKQHIKKFPNYLSRQNKRIRFTSHNASENSISILDMEISKNINKFTTSVHRKLNYRDIFTNFGSFIAESNKYNLHFTLLHRAFKLYSDFEPFHQKIDKLKIIFENNSYSKSFAHISI